MLMRLLVDVAPSVCPRGLRGRTRDLKLPSGVEHLQGPDHGVGEDVGVVLAAEVETIHLLVVPPLVKGRSRLIIFQTLQYGTVDNHLVVLKFASNHSECVVDEVVVDVDL